jgi:hypothetical protein
LISERNDRKEGLEKLFFCSKQFLDFLRDKLEATIGNSKRMQTINYSVAHVDSEFDTPIVFEETKSEDDQIFNPKGLSLGCDGKPIPL